MNSKLENLNLKIGNYTLHPIPTGEFGLDGGAMFGTVPKVLWEKAIPADEKNRIPMEARALLLKSDGSNILIDCGNGGDYVAKYGDKLGHQFESMYNISSEGPNLKKSLAKFGIKPEDIHHVIFSHLHFDHCGGGTEFRDGKIKATFPNAKYYVQKSNYETAIKPNRRERASYLQANFQCLIEDGTLQLIDGAKENLLPNISVRISDGHTQGQQVIIISDDKKGIVYCADLVPTSAHVKLAWVMGYDLNPLKIIEEKQQLLSEVAAKNWYLFFEHDPVVDISQIIDKGHDFALKEF